MGLDLSKVLLRHARRRNHRIPLVQADMRYLPIRPGAFDGIWAAASLIHLPKPAMRTLLRDVKRLVRPGGMLAATFVHGRASGFLRTGWIAGRYFSRWHRKELAVAVRRAGWTVLRLTTVVNRERRGRWLNLLARRP
jgi:SAM-dependent methyltransferase